MQARGEIQFAVAEIELDPDRGGCNVRCRGLLRSAARSEKEQRWKKERRPGKPQNPIRSLTPPTHQISGPWSLSTMRPTRRAGAARSPAGSIARATAALAGLFLRWRTPRRIS